MQKARWLDYGMIGNGQICALVSAVGSIDWLCMPAFDGPFVFDRILDNPNGGHFMLVPTDAEQYTVTQRYEQNSNVLVTTYVSPLAAFAIYDFMPRWEVWDGSKCYAPPELCRYVEVLSNEPELVVRFSPRKGCVPDFCDCVMLDPNTLHCDHQEQPLYLMSSIPAHHILEQSPVRLSASAFFILSYGHPVVGATVEGVKEKLARTNFFWQRWIKNCYLPDEYHSAIIRSALTLKLMVYEQTGAVIAAPTTSIPEIMGGSRNWDYRFCWIRDTYFTVNALLQLSKFEETENYIAYLTRIILEHPAYLRPLYSIDGQTVHAVSILDHLPGFEGSKPVRVGNDATLHHQTDAYGEAVLSIFPVFMDQRAVCQDLDQLWHCLDRLVTMAIEKFPETDNGIWEFGNLPDHYTFSKLMCWAAVDRGCKIAYHLKKNASYRLWNRRRNIMRQEILKNAWNEELQAFTQAYGGTALDASTLLMPVLGFIEPKDPRMLATIQRSEEQLQFNGLMFRYTHEDGLGTPENAFTICTFWLIDALILSGQKRKARRYFEHLLTFGNPLGLFSEDINQKTGELTGNFPQSYTHVAIIHSAMLLAGRSI